MLFKEKSDYNLSFVDNNYLFYLNNLKFSKLSGVMDIIKYVYIYFIFFNISELEKVDIQRYFLFLWMCFGKVGYLIKLTSVFRLGVRYYSFFIGVRFFKSKDLYKLLVFLFDKFMVVLDKYTLSKDKKHLVLKIQSLDFFTGLSLYPGIFFIRVLKPLYVKFELNIVKLDLLSFLKG